MRLPSHAIPLILALSPVPAVAAQADTSGEFVIREAIHAEPVALSVLTDGLVEEGQAKRLDADSWRKRQTRKDMREALEEAIDAARSAERF